MDTPPQRQLRTDLDRLALPALVVTLGLQLLRVFIPSLAWYLRDTLGVGSAVLGACAFGTFLLGFIVSPLRRALGPTATLRYSVGGLALVRLAEQIVHDPAVDLGLSLFGTVAFLIALPALVAHLRASDAPTAAIRLAGGLTLGLALDTAIKGFGGTLDLSWSRGIIPIAVIAAECAAMLYLVRREPAVGAGVESEVAWPAALPLLGIGPLLFLQAMVYQNQGWIAQVAGLSAAAAFVLTMMGNLVLAAGVWIGLTRPYALRPLTGFLGIACLALSASAAVRITPAFTLNVVIAQFVVGWSLAAIAMATAPPTTGGIVRTSISLNLGLIVFLGLTFAYYVSLDLPLPVSRRVATARGGRRLRADRRRRHRPLARCAGCRVPHPPRRSSPSPASSCPPWSTRWCSRILRRGAADRRTPARADLQHPFGLRQRRRAGPRGDRPRDRIDRGRTSSPCKRCRAAGCSTARPTWSPGWRIGSTCRCSLPARPILSGATLCSTPANSGERLGAAAAGRDAFPRGYLWASIDAGLPEPLLVIVTHLHHVESEHAPRLAQVPVLLGFWNQRPYSILLGDLNSEPDYAEMQLIADAGRVDSWAEAGTGDGLTWPAVGPFERIDWVWHTPDLRAVDADVPATTASDHLPLFVSLEVGP